MWRYFILLVSLFIFGCDFIDDSSFVPDQQEITVDESAIVTGEEADNVIKTMEDTFWLSDSGVLHNSLCRWYKKSEGQIWDGNADYTNCKNCGGTKPIVHQWNLK